MSMKVCGRQFAIAPYPVEIPELTTRESFGGLHVRCHIDLEICKAEAEDREILLLGTVVDPFRSESTNQEITRRLGNDSLTFDQLEGNLATLGGRWVVLFRIGSDARLYLDAGGTKSVYYSHDGRIASSPVGLGCKVDVSLRKYPGAGAWPLGYTPFEGVRQLLPNHFLDLTLWRTGRFGPCSVETSDIDFAVDRILSLLRGCIEAIVQRGSVALPLTGGFDSRTLLSAAVGRCLDKIELFSILDGQTDRHDYVLPQILARRVGKPLRFVKPEPVQRVELNTCGMYQDPNANRISAFAQADYVLLGHLSEITRCFYWKDGIAPEVTADSLSRLAGFGGDFGEVFKSWLEGVPMRDAGSILDLFYWECRAGNWASNCCTALDGFCNVISPYNCRRLLEVGLGVDVKHRQQPFELHRRLCRPELADVPFNVTALESIESHLPGWFPWTLRMRLRHLGRPVVD